LLRRSSRNPHISRPPPSFPFPPLPPFSAPGVVGTYSYLSPEIITRKLYTEASDVWALGVLTYILVCGYPPFYAEGSDSRPLFTAICRGQFEFHDDAWHDVSASAKQLIARMLVIDPKKRATIQEVLAHPWIVQHATLPVLHRTSTISNLRSFNARRRLRAAAKAVAWGAGHFHAVRDLESVLGGKTLGQDELARLSAAFHRVAHARNTVTLGEFTDVLTTLGYGSVPLTRLFSSFDVDDSGDVDYREFIAGLAALRGEDEAALRICFKVFDADNDGSVSRDELIQLLVATGFDPAPAAAGGAAAGAATAAAAAASSAAAAASTGAGAAAAAGDSDEAAIEAAAVLANASDVNGRNIRPLDPAYLARLEGVFAKIDANKDGTRECVLTKGGGGGRSVQPGFHRAYRDSRPQRNPPPSLLPRSDLRRVSGGRQGGQGSGRSHLAPPQEAPRMSASRGEGGEGGGRGDRHPAETDFVVFGGAAHLLPHSPRTISLVD
jgi:Ca2+-binding EF-hand superfamily protein